MSSGRRPKTPEELQLARDVSHRIWAIRDRHGLTQAQFAERVGAMRQHTVCRWESGTALPETYSLYRICREFGVSLDWLVFGNEEVCGNAD